MKKQTISINGMSCQSCEKIVTKRVSTIPGVLNVKVDLENGKATVETEQEFTQAAVEDVLKDTHYTITSVSL